ncbi:transmembrane protein 53 [Dorcoceras hygrometricum]|uniref:Transmembrane protein 53 n=1 Tax=Dorcoceras hygrometricum TaxID=472368 RepID=A0A2Z7DAF2_9LAMI|nr:transmembrane protein 53 [Dorcoceras hygrometricum]
MRLEPAEREALHCFVLATGYLAVDIVSCATSFGLLPESSGFLAVLIVAQYKVYMLAFQHVAYTHGCEGERQYRTLISLLGSLATMRRVIKYHSSWARQQQVEWFDASGNPGSTAGRGFNPAGGAPGGG